MGARSKYDMAPCIRHNTLKALKLISRKKGLTLSEVIAEEIEDIGLAEWLKVASKFNAREARLEGVVNHQHDHRHTAEPVSETTEWVVGMLGGDPASETEKPSTH